MIARALSSACIGLLLLAAITCSPLDPTPANSTLVPTTAPIATPTSTPAPTAARTPESTSTSIPARVSTNIPGPTVASTPVRTSTPTLAPTDTPASVPTPTSTLVPESTPTLVPVPTSTPTLVPVPTSTPVPAPTPTPTPKSLYTPNGVEYYAGVDGDYKYVESKDGLVRVEAFRIIFEDHEIWKKYLEGLEQYGYDVSSMKPLVVADDDMLRYLDHAYRSNRFVADFFDDFPVIGIRFSISPDGTNYLMRDLTSGWRPDFFPFNIESHTSGSSGGVVHEFAHIWASAYYRIQSPMHEFWATYLGGAAIYVASGGEVTTFTLSNCSECFGHGNYYWDDDGNLQDREWYPELDPYGLTFRLQSEYEPLGFQYIDFKELAKRLVNKSLSLENVRDEMESILETVPR